MIFEIEFQLVEFTAAGLEGSLDERTALDHPLGECDALFANWKIVHYTHVDPDLPKPDFFTVLQLGNMGIMPSVLSHNSVKKHLHEAGELLPITFGGENAYLFHPLKQLDALDKKRSKFWTLSNGDVICDLPVFPSSFSSPCWFFRVPGSKVLFTVPEFVTYYQENGLTGLEFHPQRMSDA